MSHWLRLGGALIATLLFGGCTDANLQFIIDNVDNVNNDQLAVQGEFCTSRADEVTFPVKLLIVIDQSASLQCTDPGNARLAALNQAGAALDPLPNVEFGVVGFASWSRITDFTPDWSVAAAAPAPASGQGGPATDYQGALSTALTMLEQDMIASGPAQTARTRYVVLFMGDGVPEPRCRAGCGDGGSPPDSLYGVCNTTQAIDEGDYVGMLSPCPEYNQEPQIVRKVQDIVALGEYHGVGDLSFNTVFIYAPEAEVTAACGDVGIFGYDRTVAEPLLRTMAQEGEGTYRDVNTSADIDFLNFSYESLQAPYKVAEFFALNSTAIRTETGFVNDSDSDGLPDETEFAEQLERLKADSDRDGFGDFLERTYANHGFSANDSSLPASGCDDGGDRDGDGLRACEEAFLDTDPRLPDTDGDRIPDGLELRLGMDPTRDDVMVDHDLDGRVAGTEIRAGTHPRLFDDEAHLVNQIRYIVDEVPADDQAGGGSTCYDFTFEGITLTTPLGDLPEEKGRNRVLVYAEEEPTGLSGSRGRFHVTCVEARYMGELFKAPQSGRIENISRYRFIELQQFDPDLHCLALDEDPARRPEWAWDLP